MKLAIRQIYITDSGCECVVNAANANLAEGSGVCGAIFEHAGRNRLRDACSRYGGCSTGDAVITPGFKLCKYIIHAVGPIYNDGKHHEKEKLESCYRKAMNLAYENRCESICFPLISGGIYGYPLDECFMIALSALNDWAIEHKEPDIDVVFAIPEEYKYNKGKELIESLKLSWRLND
ncbi:MAG: macro domain-containing protein [Erysipelotrichaceae bacterium]|nr:macro domain-containing protein [Erysipelotrichaceae bacterium]